MTRTGYIFGGWYKDAACTNQWNFAADSVNGNITLYAGWYSPTTVPGSTLAAKLQWLSTNAVSNSGYLLEVTSNYEDLYYRDLSYSGKSNITIQLKGIGSSRVIATSSGFSIGSDVTLILDENLILRGNIQVKTGGTLIMNQGVKITSNTGGVYVSGGTFSMSGGEISGNTSHSYSSSYGGGGVYVGSNVSLFDKTGGTIYGYIVGDNKSNVVKDNADVVQNDLGHAVYVYNNNSSYIKRKETTAGPTVNLSYIGRLTPPIWDGAWDN